MFGNQKTRWIRWDGFEDPDGVCNQGLDPVSTMTGVKARLRLLGCFVGEIDEAEDEELADAIEMFTTHTEVDKTRELTDAVRAELESLHDEGLKVYTVDSPGSSSTHDAGAVRQASRSVNERTNVDATLAISGKLAVRIMEVPASFVAANEYCGIKVQLTGYSNIKSLLLRIYRSCPDPAAAEAPPPHAGRIPDGDRIFYQEFINRAQIKALPDKKPGTGNVAINGERKSWFLRNVRCQTTPYFQQTEAPYKVKVWVSTSPSAFDHLRDDPEDDVRPVLLPAIVVEGQRLSELHRRASDASADTSTLSDPIERIEELAGMEGTDLRMVGKNGGEGGATVSPPSEEETEEEPEEADPVELDAEPEEEPNPEVRAGQLVHDESNRFEAGLLAEHRSAPKLLEKKYWTAANEVTINLIGRPCPDHDLRYQLDNQFQTNQFVERLEMDALATWKELRGLMGDPPDPNFFCADLAEVFDNMGRHVRRIQQAICCGESSWLPDDRKSDIRDCCTALLDGIGEQRAGDYPYLDCMRFVQRFVDYIDYIVWHTKTIPEWRFHYGDRTFSDGRLAEPRTKVDGLQFTISIRDDWNKNHPNDFHGIARRSYSKGADNTETSWVDSCLLQWEKNCDVGEIVGPFLYPSYNALNVTFFSRVREVPVFMMGLIDVPWISADGIRTSPGSFFNHDGFHVIANENTAMIHDAQGGMVNDTRGSQGWGTMYNRLNHLVGLDGWDQTKVIEFWAANASRMREAMTQLTADERLALEVVLFCLYHEPFTALLRKGRYPAVIERTALERRLRCGLDPRKSRKNYGFMDEAVLIRELERRVARGEFGLIPGEVRGRFDWARYWLLEHLEEIPDAHPVGGAPIAWPEVGRMYAYGPQPYPWSSYGQDVNRCSDLRGRSLRITKGDQGHEGLFGSWLEGWGSLGDRIRWNLTLGPGIYDASLAYLSESGGSRIELSFAGQTVEGTVTAHQLVSNPEYENQDDWDPVLFPFLDLDQPADGLVVGRETTAIATLRALEVKGEVMKLARLVLKKR